MNHLPRLATLAAATVLGSAALVNCGPATPEPTTGPGDDPATTDTSTKAKPITTTEGTTTAPPSEQVIVVTFAAKSDSKLTGSATIGKAADGVRVAIEVANLSPGKRGAHFHETGDCSAPDGSSAGGHFNPDGHDHALPDGQRHLGDLGNIEIGEDGKGKLEIVVKGANLEPGDPHSLRGRAIIIHAQEDDGSQPTGNAGARIGCAVVPAE